MAAWSIADVRAIAPEFTIALVDDPTVTNWIARAERRFDVTVWGDRLQDAGAYLTAHLMVISGIGPYAGQTHTGTVTQMTVGQVSVSYSVPMQNVLKAQPTLGLSRYGIMYAELLSLVGLGLMVL